MKEHADLEAQQEWYEPERECGLPRDTTILCKLTFLLVWIGSVDRDRFRFSKRGIGCF